ncbi:hypothetical protein F2Q70_00012255 [Brassica cretica]|uniref:SWIM-type domain-containing protein n=1 Tax=Brassica cretica TaxID=69181 RepID=A0A8S9LZD4_BRACR|nr:hypothetical protein F2Q70_00012255 [Brassica cretica]
MFFSSKIFEFLVEEDAYLCFLWLWKFDPLKGWGFAIDKNKRGRVLYIELTSSFEDLRRMAFEDFGIDQNLVELDGNNGNIGVDNEKSNSPFREQGEPSSFPPRDDSVSSSESSKDVEDNSNSNGYEEDDVLAISAKEDDSGKSVRFSLMDVVKRDRRINKDKTFLVQPVDEYPFLVRGDTIDCLVDLDRRTCSCGKYDLLKIPCRHAIKAGLTVGRAPSSLTDNMYSTSTWRTAYKETINPIGVPEDSWVVPDDV